jgi:hypothetical protein
MVIGTGGCPDWMVNWDFDRHYNCARSRGQLYRRNSTTTEYSNSTVRIMTFNLKDFQTFKNYDFLNERVYAWQEAIAFSDPLGDATKHPTFPMPIMETWSFNYTWTGLLGIDQRPININDRQTNRRMRYPSLLQSMKDLNAIPSLSWGYFAGSRNRKSVLLWNDVLSKC